MCVDGHVDGSANGGVSVCVTLVMLQAYGSDDGYTHAILKDLMLSQGK